MKIRKKGTFFGNIVSMLAIVSFLIVSQGAVMTASAAEWELWPKGRGMDEPTTPEGKAAAGAGEKAGKSTSAGVLSGTTGKAALVAAGLIAVSLAIAGGGGGGGGGTATTHH